MLKVIKANRAIVAALAFGASLTAIATASANPGAPGMQPPAPGQMDQPGPQASQENEVQQVLAKYGQFFKHDKYGDVWKPMQVAQNWRPYEPCHWVYNQQMQSWFFDDKTEWGSIVHHYGRWTMDQQYGWIWVPGSEFSPGWVSWEMRGDQVGWAPLPPEQDAAMIQSAEFKNDPNLWTFVAFASLGKGCAGSAPPPPQPRAMAPAPLPAVGGGYVSGGYSGGYVGGGWVGGYVPGKIVIVHGCWSHPKWCSWWHGKNWHWPKHHWPHGHAHGPHGHGPHGCKAAWCVGGKHPGGNGPNGNKPGKAIPLIGHNTVKPNWNKHFPNPQNFGQKPFPNRIVNHGPRFNNRFTMNQPRFNHRPMHFQQRSITPRQNFAPRMSNGGGMRFAGGGMRRR